MVGMSTLLTQHGGGYGSPSPHPSIHSPVPTTSASPGGGYGPHLSTSTATSVTPTSPTPQLPVTSSTQIPYGAIALGVLLFVAGALLLLVRLRRPRHAR